ncbi:hypothetical protein BC827DRAFT_1228827 [Russula dissimulans]|nr:hypothetical protein BC827DRAFT_1228827 [Russula dissimulans]
MSAPATRPCCSVLRSSSTALPRHFASPTHKPKGIQQKSTSMIRRILPRIHFFRTIIPRGSRPILPLTSHASTPETRTLTRTLRIAPFRSIHATPVRLSSSSAPDSPDDAKEPGSGSLSQRLKTLMTAYGWYAVGVYFAVSVVDFAVAFAGINLLGAEYVSSVAASAKASLLSMVYSRPPEPGREEIEDASGAAGGAGGQEGLYAMLVLAYTVHKTLFLPVRIGFTAAFTPRLVNWLRARGWAGGEGTRRAMHEMRERLRDRD